LVVPAAPLAVLLLCGAVARAHEIGTTRVSVLLHDDRSYTIEIVTDAASLVEKLEASAGRPPGAGNDPARQQALLRAFDDVFRRRLTVAFDGSTVDPAIKYSVQPQRDGASPAMATVRLTGATPSGARTLTWTYGWTFASYALMVTRDRSANPATEWLEGGQTSAPIALSGAAPAVERLDTARRYLVLGFAGALKELGLPRSEFLTALVTFNAGVEAGQLTVIAAAFLIVGWHCRARDWYRSRVVIPASAAIAFTALYWTVQRLPF
jgi:hypothetical protein